MRVIHILHELKFSGAEIMYVDAAPTFQEMGCDLSVVATAENLGEYAPNFQKAGYDVYHRPCPKVALSIKRFIYYWKFLKFLRRGGFDVVHIHSSGLFFGMSLCAKIVGIRSVYTFHNVFPTHWYSRPYHVFLRWSAKLIFNCKFQTISDSVYENELTRFKNQTTKIHNWYGNKRFFPARQNEKNEIRSELGVPKDSLVFISVGGCSEIKRHTDIIKAMPAVLEVFPNSVYLHLGEGISLNKEIELAKQLGVSDHIYFGGNKNDVRKYLVAADIYVMPSRFEGISLTTVEAMASGIPTILYDVSGLRDFNKEGKFSLLIPEDFSVLSQKIIYLRRNPDEGAEMAGRARKYVEDKYSMEKNARQIFELYNDLK